MGFGDRSEVATRGRARLGMGFEATGGDVVRARLRLIGFAADDGSDGRARARLGRIVIKTQREKGCKIQKWGLRRNANGMTLVHWCR